VKFEISQLEGFFKCDFEKLINEINQKRRRKVICQRFEYLLDGPTLDDQLRQLPLLVNH